VKTIYYLGNYRSALIAGRRPQGSAAADYKMCYLISAMKTLGYRVVVLSLLSSGLPGYHRRKVCTVDDLEEHVYLASVDFSGRLLCTAAACIRLLLLLVYLVRRLRSTDTLLVYHAQLLSLPVRLAKLVRRFRLILELEEIFFKEARTPREVKREKTELALIKAADRYLAVNETVRHEFCAGKPAVISCGAYDTPPKIAERYNDGSIHIVYAGIINATHGAHMAVDTMLHLDDGYRLHICGFGHDREIELLKDRIAKVNSRLGAERIYYHGTLTGTEFGAMLQHCHLGLNFNITQKPDAGKYAFPSKILSYLGHGLNVLTYRIPSVVRSEFAPFVQFFDKQTPEAVAAAIRSAVVCSYETQAEKLRDFDDCFTDQLQVLFGEAGIQ
jgi:hypothetical protein